MRLARLILAFSLLFLPICATQAAEPVPTREQVLVDLSRVWYTARLFHPRAAADTDAWDARFIALIDTIPATPDHDALVELLDAWLLPLGDPWSGVARSENVPRIAPAEWKPVVERSPGRITVRLPDGQYVAQPYGPALEKLKVLGPELANEEAVVIDLRQSRKVPTASYLPAYLVEASRMLDPLIATSPVMPQVRTRAYQGFVPETGSSSGGYSRQFRFQPFSLPFKATGTRDRKLVFVVNRHVTVPVPAIALQREGRAAIVSEDGAIEVVGAGIPVQRMTVGGVPVAVRCGDFAWDVESTRWSPNVTLRDGESMSAAVDAVIATWPPQPPARRAADTAATTSLRLEEARFPARAERLFGVLKAWWTIERFFPYADLADRKWETALAPALARAEAATTSVAYERALGEMLAYTDDAHVGLGSVDYRRMFGRPAAIAARFVEGQLVVTRRAPPEQLGNADVRVGDVILAIGGRDVAAMTQELRARTAASTEAGFREKVARYLMQVRGDDPLQLDVRHADGSAAKVAVPIASTNPQTWPAALPVVHELEKGIGYVDLARLDSAGVDAMFEHLKNAPAIVFDMRGYPRGTAWAIAARLAQAQGLAAARFDRRVVVPTAAADSDSWETYTFIQRVPTTDKPRYAGRTVMLVDERAISQSEHSGLLLRAANGTRFIGSATAGANGDVTVLRIPGGYTVAFTGQSVRWPDGRALQRVGLVPDIEVVPTLAGVRSGADEVLERAVATLRQELSLK